VVGNVPECRIDEDLNETTSMVGFDFPHQPTVLIDSGFVFKYDSKLEKWNIFYVEFIFFTDLIKINIS